MMNYKISSATSDDHDFIYALKKENLYLYVECKIPLPKAGLHADRRNPTSNKIIRRARWMAMTEFPAGRLENIEFVAIFTRYKGKWVYCWHKYRESYEHPGGHVESGETPLEAAKRELYEETGIKDCRILPLWDYEYIYEDGQGKNNGRVFYAEVISLGELPESEMERIEFFDTVPENYTYNRADEIKDLANVDKMLKAYKE